MNKGIKLFTILISILALCLMPFSIYADATYYEISANTQTLLYHIPNYNNRYNWFKADKNVRLVKIKNSGSTNYNLYIICNEQYHYMLTESTETYIINNLNNTSTSFNRYGTLFYYYTSTPNTGLYVYDINIPEYETTGLSSYELIQKAYDYTYGDLSNDGITYGDLNDVGFYTKFTNSQQATLQTTKYNLDVFTWDNTYDALGNQINVPVGDFVVDIQGALSDYEANTKSDLLNQVLNDATIGTWNDIATVSANAGTYQLTWEEACRSIMGIYDYNTNIFEELVVRPFENYYIKKGWIYRIRLRKSDDSYTGNWQIVYNITSMPPKDSNNVINHYYIYNNTLPSDDTNEVLQTINNYNNTVNNWYVNDTPIPVSSNDSDNTLLQTILNLLNGSDDSSLLTVGDETQQTINNAINTEDDYLNDLQDQLDDLELNDISDNNGLMNSLNWIRQVHNLTIEQTLYSGIVITILSVGLIMYLIGRRNG